MGNWILRLREDRDKLDEESKLRIIKSALIYAPPFLSQEEVETFLAPQENLSNPDVLIAYADIEKKVALAYSGGDKQSKKWEREKHLKEIRDILSRLHTNTELDELESLLISPLDVDALTMGLVGGHYWGMRRIRNAYLPRITDILEIDTETGQVRDATRELFREGPEDAVSRIERVLGVNED